MLPQWGFATTSARVFQIYRVAEVWHFLVGNTEEASMTWNAVGPYVQAGIESYNPNVGTNYLVHNSMNKTLSESGWIAFNGSASVGGQNSARMCSQYLSASSFQEKQFAVGTSC